MSGSGRLPATSGQSDAQEGGKVGDCAPSGQRCNPCSLDAGRSVYHYSCAVCGLDCTAGTQHGPATTALDGVTRCCACNEAYGGNLARQINALPELIDIVTRLAKPATEAQVSTLRSWAQSVLSRIEARR